MAWPFKENFRLTNKQFAVYRTLTHLDANDPRRFKMACSIANLSEEENSY